MWMVLPEVPILQVPGRTDDLCYESFDVLIMNSFMMALLIKYSLRNITIATTSEILISFQQAVVLSF